MTLLHPYPPNPDYMPWSVGHDASDREDARYTFTNYESLVEYFGQWLGHDFVIATIENEKQVFMVRKEVSLEETRLQFLKKCEGRLFKAMKAFVPGQKPDWGHGP